MNKTNDIILFMINILYIFCVIYLLASKETNFLKHYVSVIPIFMVIRMYTFYLKKWQYYLYDFCYFVVGLTMIQLVLSNMNYWMFYKLYKILFILTNGPVLMAIVVWRNSLVFHDVQKIISILLHLYPAILYYTIRWNQFKENRDNITWSDMILAMSVYFIWQVCYFIKTEITDKPILDSNTKYMTSFRWFSYKIRMPSVLSWFKNVGLISVNEKIDNKNIKLKMIFMFCQYVYTLLTILIIPPFIYRYQTLHFYYISGICLIALFNGASYYVHVYGRNFYKE